MKTFRMFSILLIGMISLTATAKTTAKPEQKCKIELIKEFSPEINLTSVVDYSYQATEVVITNSVELRILKFGNDSFNPVAILSDVGWKSKQRFIYIPYKEKLHNKRIESNMIPSSNGGYRIRDNC
ncbi:hypothetical protein OX284_014520 [Flavobacterium sp. SUN046]|uniref:hypothetical protein n=1 Tax=Flavobacterium sp. SUN046 TaxID=3002440 RepID=UPI002DB84D2E|nr:hypothetical protein [Flavobacterium sp. SUN046]MEC4050650.1 hypothetical protein [Flavobacterium sp. SUN046]